MIDPMLQPSIDSTTRGNTMREKKEKRVSNVAVANLGLELRRRLHIRVVQLTFCMNPATRPRSTT